MQDGSVLGPRVPVRGASELSILITTAYFERSLGDVRLNIWALENSLFINYHFYSSDVPAQVQWR